MPPTTHLIPYKRSPPPLGGGSQVGRRRRKKMRKAVRRVSPLFNKYFTCPVCGQQTLTISIKKEEVDGHVKHVAEARCGNCKLYCRFEVAPTMEKIDVYNMVVDYVNEGRIDECSAAPGEEAEEEAEEVEGEAGEATPGAQEQG